MSFKNFSYAGVRGVSVENFGSGSIVVEPGAAEDQVDGSLNADPVLLEAVVVRHDGAQLRVVLPQHLFRSGNAHLRMSVPPGLDYVIKAGSADISISAEMRQAKITSGSGDVSVEQAADLDCTTGSGSIGVHRLVGRAARLATGSGDITVGEADSRLSAKSGSGDITVRSLRRSELVASSGSGDIAVPSTTGSLDLRSASGSLTVGVADGLAAWLDLSSVSGTVRIALDAGPEPGPGEPYVSVRARTASGEIAVFRA